MLAIVTFSAKWAGWYRVLRCEKSFNFADSLRYGMWLASS